MNVCQGYLHLVLQQYYYYKTLKKSSVCIDLAFKILIDITLPHDIWIHCTLLLLVFFRFNFFKHKSNIYH